MAEKIDPRITQILVCPICKGPLLWDEEKGEFYCCSDMKAYAVVRGIACMNPSEARDMTEQEVEEKSK